MMRSPVERTREALRTEKGVTLILAAMVLPILLGMAGFAADFGWLFWNGIKIQHGADAAALSGVVYEPEDQTTAYAEAIASAAENGFDDLSPSTDVTPVDFSDDPSAVYNPNQLRVTVEHSVPTFFMKVFGIDSVTIGRSAVAEYVLPLAMGSDWPYFGQDPVLGRSPNYWGNIHGYYTGRTMGDRYSSQCVDGGSGLACAKNGDRRQTISQGTNNGFADYTGGYIYGIEVPAGASNLAVEVFDGPFYRGGSDYFLVGDNEQGTSQGPTTRFMLYSPDPTPLDTTDGNTLLCSVTYAPQDTYADFDGDGNVGSWNSTARRWTADPDDDRNGDGWFDWTDVSIEMGANFSNLWDRMCGNVFNAGPGIYPLRVVIADPGASDDRGLNRYSLRAFTTGPAPRVFALGDMAIYANFAGNQATFNLAEVPEVHAGKELVIELWDPDSGNNGVRINLPDGSLPPCTWNATDGRTGSLGGCDISYTTSFNNHHMQIRIDIPNDYACSANCWWEITVRYPGGANDTTTWSARIEGNPVRLVE